MKQAPSSKNSIKYILFSHKPSILVLRSMLIIATSILGVLSLICSMESLLPQNIFRKDFIQEYLLAKAVLNGIDPYIPLPELANRLLGPLPNLVFQHPTPHPPPVILLSLPLGWLTYQQAAIVWFSFELACILVSVYLFLHWFGVRLSMMHVLTCTLLVLAWSPVRDELTVGQLMTLNLALLVGSWQMLRIGNDVRGGILLGSAIALKLIAWPLAFFLVLGKRWKASGTVAVVLLAANGIVTLIVGIQSVSDYYLKVGPVVSMIYQSFIGNFSSWTIGWRVLAGTGSSSLTGITAPPLFYAPSLASYASVIIPVTLLSVGLILAKRTSTFDASFGMMTCVSLLIAPITWSHYLLLALIPLAIVWQYLLALDLPRKETNFAILLSLLLSISQSSLNKVMLMFANQSLAGTGSPSVPFTVTIISLTPAIAILGFMCLIWSVDQLAISAKM